MSESKKIKLSDTTLRDGEQAPGVNFNEYEKFCIAEALEEFGIEEVEVGTPAVSVEERIFIHELVKHNFNFKTSCWSRLRQDDVNMSLDTGVDLINVSLPVSDILLKAMGKSRLWLLNNLDKVIDMEVLDKSYCSIGLQDASRADREFLKDIIDIIKHNKFYRMRIADTVGILNPFSTESLVKFVRGHAGDEIKLEFHGHNDLGMAVGNSFSAVMNGVDYISTTVNGIGERAGNCPLEAISTALQLNSDIDSNWNLSCLNRLCAMVSVISKRKLPVSHPIVGNMVYTHESGIHVKCLMKDPNSYQLFQPEIVGCTPQTFSIGKLSGSKTKFLKLKDRVQKFA